MPSVQLALLNCCVLGRGPVPRSPNDRHAVQKGVPTCAFPGWSVVYRSVECGPECCASVVSIYLWRVGVAG